jgi:hypothetical protein
MDFNQPSDDNSEKKIIKKELDFCERFFVDQLVKDFPDHLDLVITYISNKSSEINGFKEKQALTEVTKKLSSNKFSITEQFKTLLRKHIKNKIETKSLLDIKLNWDQLHFTDDEHSLENTTIINFKDTLKKALGNDLIEVLNYTNFLVGDTKNIFSEDVLSQALSHTLKGTFSSMNSFCLAIDAFAYTWSTHLPSYYSELRNHLEENGIDQKIKQVDIDSANILNNIPKSQLSDVDNKEKNIEKPTNFLAAPSMFSVGDVDLDAFLRALPPAPKIEKKEDSVLSVSDIGDLDINDISNLPKITPSLDTDNDKEFNKIIEEKHDSKQVNSSSELTNNEIKVSQPIGSNNPGANNASTLSAIDALAQHGNIQVIVVQGQSSGLENVVSAINNGNNLNGSNQNGSGEYTEGYDGPREAPIDPEVARELAIQKIANDINKALLSQQRIDPIDFFSLLKKELVVPEIAENESKIISLPRFLETLKDVQSKFLKVNLEIFKKTKIFKKSIFLEILKNKLFAENVNYYDIFVLRLMAKTYQALFENESISQYQKLILFKTQLWVLQVALSDQSFWYFKDNPARVLFDFIINPELQNNKPLIEQFDNVIKTFDATVQINSDFFISLIHELKQEINKDLETQKELFADKTKPLEKEEWFNFAYAQVSEQVMSITNNCEYEPIKDFAEKIWPYKFLQKLSKMTSLTIFDLPDFTKVLPANMKSMLNQHFIVFDALVTLANNKDGSKNQMEKLKKFISKANEGLATLAFDLDIDPRLTRALFSFVKYKLDVISQTTNPIAIENSMNKISSNENAFKKEINSMVEDNLAYIKANREIVEQKYELEKFIKLNHWYTINENLLKLLYITKRKDYYIFVDMLKNEIRIINKPAIWEFIKKEAIKNLTDETLQLNMLNFLVEYNLEIANNHIEHHVAKESSGETNEKESN